MRSKRLALALIAISATLVLLTNCSNPASTSASASSMRFLDKGAVVPDPVSTLVTVDPLLITYNSSQGGTLRDSWSSVISPDDFSMLMLIVKRFVLQDAPDPILPQGMMGCDGARGMTIFTMLDGRPDTLNISGLVLCYRACWPLGLDSLTRFEKTLVNKYKH